MCPAAPQKFLGSWRKGTVLVYQDAVSPAAAGRSLPPFPCSSRPAPIWTKLLFLTSLFLATSLASCNLPFQAPYLLMLLAYVSSRCLGLRCCCRSVASPSTPRACRLSSQGRPRRQVAQGTHLCMPCPSAGLLPTRPFHTKPARLPPPSRPAAHRDSMWIWARCWPALISHTWPRWQRRMWRWGSGPRAAWWGRPSPRQAGPLRAGHSLGGTAAAFGRQMLTAIHGC